jgi:hypothetical protein
MGVFVAGIGLGVNVGIVEGVIDGVAVNWNDDESDSAPRITRVITPIAVNKIVIHNRETIPERPLRIAAIILYCSSGGFRIETVSTNRVLQPASCQVPRKISSAWKAFTV